MNSTALHFRPEDIRPAGGTPGTTIFCYVVCQDDEPIGQVNVGSAFALINAGEDVPTWIAARLNQCVENMDETELRELLADVLAL